MDTHSPPSPINSPTNSAADSPANSPTSSPANSVWSFTSLENAPAPYLAPPVLPPADIPVYAPGEDLFLPVVVEEDDLEEDDNLEDPSAEPTDVRLVHVMACVVRVFVTVLYRRVRAGDSFTVRCLAAQAQLCVAELAALLPTPALPDILPIGFYPAAFSAGLNQPETPFDRKPGVTAPPLLTWLERLVTLGGCSPCVLIAVLIYVDRLLLKCPAMVLTSDNVHRIIAACYVIACKELEDRPMWMCGFAFITGISQDELRGLEDVMVRLLDFDTHIRVEDFAKAETVFMAEAMDAPNGHKVMLHLVRQGVNKGLDAAIARTKTWAQTSVSTLPEGSSAGYPAASSTDPVFYPDYTFEGDRVWRPVVGREDDMDAKARLRALAIALMNHQFPGIALDPLPGLEGQAEWQVLGMCDVPGVERFRILRDLILNFEVKKAAVPLPPLCKRLIPFTGALPVTQDRAGVGLGPTGQFLLNPYWNFGLVTEQGEDPWRELVEYGEEDIVIPPRKNGEEKPGPYQAHSPRPLEPIDLAINDEPASPLKVVPGTPPPQAELWNAWWRDQMSLRLEREMLARQGGAGNVENAGADANAEAASHQLPAIPRSGPHSPSVGNDAAHEDVDSPHVAPAAVLPPTPAAPPGFTPPQRPPARMAIQALLNEEDEEVCRPPDSSATAIAVGNYLAPDGDGGHHQNTLAFASYAAVTGNGIWADAPNPVDTREVPAAREFARFVRRGEEDTRPSDQTLAQWHAQDVLAAGALDAHQVEELLQGPREGGLVPGFGDRSNTLFAGPVFGRPDGSVEEGLRWHPTSVEHPQVDASRATGQLRGVPNASEGQSGAVRGGHRHARCAPGSAFGRRDFPVQETMLQRVQRRQVDDLFEGQLDLELSAREMGNALIPSGHREVGSVRGSAFERRDVYAGTESAREGLLGTANNPPRRPRPHVAGHARSQVIGRHNARSGSVSAVQLRDRHHGSDTDRVSEGRDVLRGAESVGRVTSGHVLHRSRGRGNGGVPRRRGDGLWGRREPLGRGPQRPAYHDSEFGHEVGTNHWGMGNNPYLPTPRSSAGVSGRPPGCLDVQPLARLDITDGDVNRAGRGLSDVRRGGASSTEECGHRIVGLSAELASSVAHAQGDDKPVDGETDESPTVVLGMEFNGVWVIPNPV